MIYVTGDLHGEFDRLRGKAFKKLKKGDTVIVCGDFGFLWDGDGREKRLLEKLGKLRYRLMFIDGCHENFDLLEQYPVSSFCGGQARVICGNLVHLLRGQVYTIEGRDIFTMGGGSCGDQADRMATGRWSPRELPSSGELSSALENLKQRRFVVDYVVTHDCSGSLRQFIGAEREEITELQSFFDGLASRLRFKKWFFGLYHLDKVLSSRHTAVFQELIPLL